MLCALSTLHVLYDEKISNHVKAPISKVIAVNCFEIIADKAWHA